MPATAALDILSPSSCKIVTAVELDGDGKLVEARGRPLSLFDFVIGGATEVESAEMLSDDNMFDTIEAVNSNTEDIADALWAVVGDACDVKTFSEDVVKLPG